VLNSVDVAVVGAGITGLTAAHRLPAELSVAVIEADRCACPGCRGELTDEKLSMRGWRHCKVCRCAWKVEEVYGQRYAASIKGMVHAVPAPQPARRTAEGEFDNEA